ncbi:putative secreted glycosyl hydrolase [Cyclobacterium qasimii M12-11B]|uniref:Putative secreted glycosyl hydrolase n=2 Tax=Cyclobacterium qasimii TaxID=1350429 RepID=S7V7Z5_9BACT|nr:putative secreted glycosyl hydrolase [Cyclobacterium qasimii M12-11B]
MGLEQDYTGGKDIIYGAEEFENFELYLEWKLPKGGNSGIFYHIPEVKESAGPSGLAPEYQLIDDENYASIHDLTSYNKKWAKLKTWTNCKIGKKLPLIMQCILPINHK